MSKTHHLIVAGLCAGGLLTGFAARRISSVDSSNSRPAAVAPDLAGRSCEISAATEGGARPASAGSPEIPHRRSTDTLETLAALPDGELYTRLAVWMTDASEADIASFWKLYGPRKDRSNDITDLIFLNWARLDPQAAIAGSSSDEHAWWAWACRDPKGALAEATANAPERVNDVARGIGEFHPEWLRVHFNELPNNVRNIAVAGMEKWADRQNPLAAVKFQKEVGHFVSKGNFQALIRKDPWAALDWLKENPGRKGGGLDYSIEDPMQFFVSTMASEHPDDLERLAAQTPSGASKFKMESALFANLLGTDRAAALDAANETTSPRAAAERFAALGLGVMKTDPEQAFLLAKELLTKSPDAMDMVAMIELPGGSGSGEGVSIPGVNDFMGTLLAMDPERTMELALNRESSVPASKAAYEFSARWARRDFAGYTGWVNRQTDPEIREMGGTIILNKLQIEGNYAESIDWVMSLREGANDMRLEMILGSRIARDPTAAAAWLESADMPAARKAEFKKSFGTAK